MNDELPEELPATSDHAAAPVASFERTRPRKGSPETDAFLRAVVKMGASDLHLKSGESARLRIGGELRTVAEEPAPTEEFEARVFRLLTEDERRQLVVDGSVDFAYDLDDRTRFRVNVYRQEAGISIAARVVPRSIPSFDDLQTRSSGPANSKTDTAASVAEAVRQFPGVHSYNHRSRRRAPYQEFL